MWSEFDIPTRVWFDVLHCAAAPIVEAEVPAAEESKDEQIMLVDENNNEIGAVPRSRMVRPLPPHNSRRARARTRVCVFASVSKCQCGLRVVQSCHPEYHRF